MHTATYYIDLLLSGITVGSLYALIAIGYYGLRYTASYKLCPWRYFHDGWLLYGVYQRLHAYDDRDTRRARADGHSRRRDRTLRV